jgi:hypothetical protein
MKDGIHMCYDCLKDGLSLWGFFSCLATQDQILSILTSQSTMFSVILWHSILLLFVSG